MEELTSIKCRLNTQNNYIKIFPLADLHIGSKECDLKLIKETIDFIKNTEDCYVILLGDILDTALKNSKTDIYSATMSLADSQKLAVELFTPIKDKIIAMTPGNHENRVWKEVGIDLSLWLAEKLGLQDVYRNSYVLLNIGFGKDNNGNPYILNVFGQHGAYGGGRRLGSAMNALEDLDGIVANADLYVRAHTHSSIQGSRKVYTINEKGNVETHYKHYFNSPSFLRTGGYGLDKGYRPQDTTPYYILVRAYNERKDSRLNKYFKIDKVSL